MKVLFEELSLPQREGGVEAACVGLARGLREMGHEIVRRDATNSLSAGWLPDVVHVHGIWSPALIARWRRWRAAGVPNVVTVHGMLEPWALAHKKWKKRLAWLVYQKRMLESTGCLHATSEGEAKNFRGLGLCPPVVLIPWGIEAIESRPEILHGSNQARSPRTALFVGRLYPVKGLPMLLEAWAKLRPAGWRLRLVGPDEAGHRAELESLAKGLGIAEMVEFAGAMTGVALSDAYRGARLFILPSHTENFGMAIGEAMAHGLPVITTQGAPWKLLETERCGWWVPVSVEGIAAALDDATRRTPEELAAMGGRGRAVVAERFAWERVAREMIACYEWVLGKGEVPDCVRRF